MSGFNMRLVAGIGWCCYPFFFIVSHWCTSTCATYEHTHQIGSTLSLSLSSVYLVECNLNKSRLCVNVESISEVNQRKSTADFTSHSVAFCVCVYICLNAIQVNSKRRKENKMRESEMDSIERENSHRFLSSIHKINRAFYFCFSCWTSSDYFNQCEYRILSNFVTANKSILDRLIELPRVSDRI